MSKELLKLLLLTIGFAESDTAEREKVREVVQWYFEGAKSGDASYIKKAFHAQAKLKHIKADGGLFEADLAHFIHYIEENGAMPVLETKILSVDITETAASVKALFVFDSFVYVDYLNLLKVQDQWVIVDKVYMKKSL